MHGGLMTTPKEPGSGSLKIGLTPATPGAAAILAHKKEVMIGRDEDCDIVVKDTKASRKHCKLTRDENQIVLEDLGSKNGTFVAGQRISGKAVLQLNQSFKVGDTVFYLA